MMNVNYNLQIDGVIADIKRVLPCFDINDIAAILEYHKEKVAQLPSRFLGDLPVLQAIKHFLLRGDSIEDASIQVIKLIDINSLLSLSKSSIGIKHYFDITLLY
ncbi:hypothetical protein [Pedobacter sp. B4-66]|uniref:hypothetical protein n=1 Tax=Pedobacter sp. B4-66 TaxID=2817280 RepID=UPI001BD9D2C5|nr:hypothetical protein [Pedobacter sp. B4-66]